MSEPHTNPRDSVSSIGFSHTTYRRSATLPPPHPPAWPEEKPNGSTEPVEPRNIPSDRYEYLKYVGYEESLPTPNVMIVHAPVDPIWRLVRFPLRFIQHYIIGTLSVYVGSLLWFALALPWITAVRPDWNILPGWPVPHIFVAHAFGALVLGAPAAALGMVIRLMDFRDHCAPAWSFRLDSWLKFTMVVGLVCGVFGLQIGAGIAPQYAPILHPDVLDARKITGQSVNELLGVSMLGFFIGDGLVFVVGAVYMMY